MRAPLPERILLVFMANPAPHDKCARFPHDRSSGDTRQYKKATERPAPAYLRYVHCGLGVEMFLDRRCRDKFSASLSRNDPKRRLAKTRHASPQNFTPTP